MSSGAAPIRLYAINSPNVTKVLIMLEELGLDYETQLVSVARSEQFSPEFLTINPLGKLPVLDDPRRTAPLFESGAILIWLAEQAERFLPAQEPARSQVMQWLMVQMAQVGPMLGQLNHFDLVLDGAETYSLGRYRAQAEKLYRLLDDRLAENQWISGDYSIADMAIQPWTHYLEKHGFDPADFPALVKWRVAIDDRPAVRAAYDQAAELGKQTISGLRKASDEDLDRFFGRTDTMPAADFSAVRRM